MIKRMLILAVALFLLVGAGMVAGAAQAVGFPTN
jgi:hypothetical protein